MGLLERLGFNSEFIENFGLKKLAYLILIMLFITDLLSFFQVPYLREIVTLLFFNTIPGLLILIILRLDKIEFIKKAVLSVMLSITFLLLVGMLINFLYPLIQRPLSFLPLILSMNVFLMLLLVITFKRNREVTLKDLLNYNISLNNSFLSLLIFPVLFPFLAFLGTYFMNISGYNGFLLLLLILIPIYLALILIFRNRIHSATYPISLWMMSMALLFIHGLTSNYIMGIDVHSEFYVFQLTVNNFHWDAYGLFNAYNSCLSITVLPTVYTVLTGISGQYVFKFIFALIGSFVPLVAYLVFKRFLNLDKAYLASLLILFQNFFMLSLGASRQLIALLFFFSAIFILFDTEISGNTKKILIILAVLSVTLSHYATTYVALTLIIPILLIPFVKKLIYQRKITFKNFDIIIPIFIFIVLWYAFLGQSQFVAGSSSVEAISESGGVTGTDARDASVLAIFGIGLRNLPNLISVVSNDLIFASIFIGLIAIILGLRYYNKKMDSGYVLGILISLTLLILFIIVPMVSKLYGAPRIFLQSLIFIAPLFVIGIDKLTKLIKIPKMNYLIIFVLLTLLFSTSTYLQYHFIGIPYSAYYESNGTLRNEYFIYDQEVVAGKWLNENYINGEKTYTDAIGSQRLLFNIDDYNKINDKYFALNKTVSNGYIFLWNTNIRIGQVYVKIESPRNITKYSRLINGKNLIFDDGFAQVLN